MYYEDLKLKDEFISDCKTITEDDFIVFCNWSGQNAGFHVDREAAKNSIFGERILPGPAVLSLSMGLITKTGVWNNAIAYLGMSSWQIRAAVRIGDIIKSRTWVISKRDSKKYPEAGIVTFGMLITNQNGEDVHMGEHIQLIKRRPQPLSG